MIRTNTFLGREAGRGARAAIRTHLDRVVPPNVLEDVELVATELATNAFAHAPPMIGDRIGLRVEVEHEVVRVVAIDGGSGFVPDLSARAPPTGRPSAVVTSEIGATATSLFHTERALVRPVARVEPDRTELGRHEFVADVDS